jgi:hypothetical protein
LKVKTIDSQGHHSELDGSKNPESVIPYILDYAMDSFWDPEAQFGLATPESWEKTLTKDAVLRKKALEVILKRETIRIRSRSQQIKNLGGEGLVLVKGEAQEIKGLREQVEELRLAVRMLEDASDLGIKLRVRMPHETPNNQKT